MDKIQTLIEQIKKKKKKFYTFHNFQLHLRYRIMAKYVFVKTEAILYSSPDGQMVKLSVSQALPKAHAGSNPT